MLLLPDTLGLLAAIVTGYSHRLPIPIPYFDLDVISSAQELSKLVMSVSHSDTLLDLLRVSVVHKKFVRG